MQRYCIACWRSLKWATNTRRDAWPPCAASRPDFLQSLHNFISQIIYQHSISCWSDVALNETCKDSYELPQSLQENRRKWSWPILKYFPSIRLARLRKSTKDSQDTVPQTRNEITSTTPDVRYAEKDTQVQGITESEINSCYSRMAQPKNI